MQFRPTHEVAQITSAEMMACNHCELSSVPIDAESSGAATGTEQRPMSCEVYLANTASTGRTVEKHLGVWETVDNRG